MGSSRPRKLFPHGVNSALSFLHTGSVTRLPSAALTERVARREILLLLHYFLQLFCNASLELTLSFRP